MGEFKMNPHFKRDLMRQVNDQLQKVFDSVYAGHAGQDVEDVKAALKKAAKRVGFTIDDPKLTELATAISAGKKLKVQAA